jgi:hypothetical protein
LFLRSEIIPVDYPEDVVQKPLDLICRRNLEEFGDAG